MKRATGAKLLLFLCYLFSTDARAQAVNDCVPAINGALKGGPGNIQDHMFHSLTIDPTNHQVVYVGTETNGIFKTTDGGQTWMRLREGLKCTSNRTGYSQIFDIGVDPANPQTLYAATVNGPGPATPETFPSASGGVYKSTNGGLTWTQKNNGLSNTYVTYVLPVATNASRLYAVLGGLKSTFFSTQNTFYAGGIYESTDGGDSWTPLALPQGVNTNIIIDAVIRGNDQRTLYASGQLHGTDAPTAYGFFRSTDAGATWTVSNPAGQTIYGFDAFKQDPRIIYGHDNSPQRRVHKSTDGGVSWSAITNAGFFGVVRIHPTNSQVLYFTGQHSVRKSSNGFLTSQEVYNDPTLTSAQQMVDIEIAESNPNVVWAAAKGYYLYRSTDAGQTWTKITAVRDAVYGVNGNLYAVVAPLYVTAPFLSYLRLINGGGTTATFTITVIGSGTGTAYGTAAYTVPTAATRQLSMSTILVDANAVNRGSGDAQFSFYIQSQQALAGYQHVTLNETARYFGNASVCSYTFQDVMREAASQVVLPSIHTSRLEAAGYPSQIELHNYANAATTYRFSIHDEVSGALIRQMDFPTRPNASYTIPWSQIESQIGFNPAADQIRANLIVTDPTGAPPQIVLGQTIVNTALSTLINMTSACAVNRPAAGSAGNASKGALP